MITQYIITGKVKNYPLDHLEKNEHFYLHIFLPLKNSKVINQNSPL